MAEPTSSPTPRASRASAPGYVLVLSGPSGAGKGTLLAHLFEIGRAHV